jgi:hypothetical protein
MKLNLLSQATWFCMKCQGLPYGMDMVVMDPTNPSVRVVWDLFGDRVLVSRLLRTARSRLTSCNGAVRNAGQRTWSFQTGSRKNPENDILASRSRIFVRSTDRASSKDERRLG